MPWLRSRGIVKKRLVTKLRDIPWGAWIRLHWREMRLECKDPEWSVAAFDDYARAQLVDLDERSGLVVADGLRLLAGRPAALGVRQTTRGYRKPTPIFRR